MSGFSEIPLDEVLHWDECTSNADGDAADADSTPTFLVFEEANDTPIISSTYTSRSLTGQYRATMTCSAANGFEVGKFYNVISGATVDGISGKKVSKSFRIVPAEATAGYREVNAAKWNNLPTVKLPLAPATAGRDALVAADGSVSPNWADVKSPTTTVGLSGTTVKTATDVASALPSAATTAAAVWNEATSGHTTPGTYGDKLGAHMKGVLKVVIGTGSTTTSIVLDSSTGIDGAAPSATNDFYNGGVLVLTSGVIAGQRASISAYVGATKTLTVSGFTSGPVAGVTGTIT